MDSEQEARLSKEKEGVAQKVSLVYFGENCSHSSHDLVGLSWQVESVKNTPGSTSAQSRSVLLACRV